MNAMTDRVLRAVMEVRPEALMIGSSSVHATDSNMAANACVGVVNKPV